MKKIFFFFIFIFVFGCKGSKIKYEGIDKSQLKNVSKLEVLNNDFVANTPIVIGLVGNKVLVADVVDGKFIHLLDKNSGKYIESLVNVGRGAGEIVQPMTTIIRNDSLIQVFCCATQKMVTYNINRYLADQPDYFQEQSFANDSLRINALYYMGHDRYLACGSQEIRFAVFDKDGKMQYQYKEYPDLKIDDIEEVRSICNYVPSIAVDTTNNKFVLATTVGCFIETFEFDQSAIRSVKQKFIYEPIYRIVEGTTPKWVTFDTDNGAITGATAARCDLDNIYMTISGTKNIGPYDNTMYLVYDWDLNLEKGYLIDNVSDAFVLDADKANVYAFNTDYNNPEDTGKLIRFSID